MSLRGRTEPVHWTGEAICLEPARNKGAGKWGWLGPSLKVLGGRQVACSVLLSDDPQEIHDNGDGGLSASQDHVGGSNVGRAELRKENFLEDGHLSLMGLTFVIVYLFGPHMMVLSGYSGSVLTQNLLLAGLGCQRLNTGQPRARQNPPPYLSLWPHPSHF